ncbi:MAG TPA: serine hydrolase domain-containing protein [Burkholderiaceae bacterium]|jgi:CubicO group peptidase (beta-lactamase class C family)
MNFSSHRVLYTGFMLMSILTLIPGCSSPPKKPDAVARGDYESTKQYISKLIQYEMKQHDVTGLSIALVDDQRIVWAQGFGYADMANGIAATPETLYRVGSISKLFTATAAMQLAEQGKIDIDKPLQTYLPSFSIKTRFPEAGPITPRNIMTHHSGLPDSMINGMWVKQPAPFAKVVDSLKDDYVAYPSNFIFAYSNIGPTLLGDAIQTITGKEFSAYMNDALLSPLGMHQSSFSAAPSVSLMSKAYRAGSEKEELALRDIPAGGLNSNVLDLSRFLQMVFAQGQSNGNPILKPASLNEMLRPQNDNVELDLDFRIGLGWMLSKNIKNGGIVAWHNGGTMFYRSQLIALPEKKLGVVVLANSFSAGPIVNRIADETLKLALEAKTGLQQPNPETSKVEEIPLRKEDLQEYPGDYATIAGSAKIIGNGDRLRAEIAGRNFALIPGEDGQFGIQYRLLGWIPFPSKQLSNVRLSHALVSNREVLIGNASDEKFILGEKIQPQPNAQKWMNYLGEYEFINGDDTATQFRKIALQYRDGFFIVEITLAPPSDNEIVRMPIAPVSDKEAIILGLGRGKGETIQSVTVDGEELIAYSGYLLRKRQQQTKAD